MGTWTAVADRLGRGGLEIQAYWEGDPETITRVSVIGTRTGRESDDAVRRVLEAYGADHERHAWTWEVGEAHDEQVAHVRGLAKWERAEEVQS